MARRRHAIPDDDTPTKGRPCRTCRSTCPSTDRRSSSRIRTAPPACWPCRRPPSASARLRPPQTLDVAGGLKVSRHGDGAILLELSSERSWAFRQLGTDAGTGLELASIGGGGNKNFVISTTGTGRYRHDCPRPDARRRRRPEGQPARRRRHPARALQRTQLGLPPTRHRRRNGTGAGQHRWRRQQELPDLHGRQGRHRHDRPIAQAARRGQHPRHRGRHPRRRRLCRGVRRRSVEPPRAGHRDGHRTRAPPAALPARVRHPRRRHRLRRR